MFNVNVEGKCHVIAAQAQFVGTLEMEANVWERQLRTEFGKICSKRELHWD